MMLYLEDNIDVKFRNSVKMFSTLLMDMNKKEIYIGDICETIIISDKFTIKKSTGIITLDKNQEVFFIYYKGKIKLTDENSKFLEIIGNVIEDPYKLDKRVYTNYYGGYLNIS